MNKQLILELKDLSDLASVATQIIDHISYSRILFIGQLGAGKTTMIKEIMKQMGCTDQGSSPSYSIINQYEGKNAPIYHIDLYRMESTEETFALGIEEILYSGHYCFIEWPQIIMDYIYDDYHVLQIDIIENNNRKIRFS
jgi:tRNA threonylcarbamoyladenosine biosynthesis protein TsaE